MQTPYATPDPDPSLSYRMCQPIVHQAFYFEEFSRLSDCKHVYLESHALIFVTEVPCDME